MNSSGKNVKVTVDSFQDDKVNFLDFKVDKNHTGIFYKNTHRRQYKGFYSQTPWRLKLASIKALFHRANKICSSKQVFQQQINKIETLMSWNAYSKYVRNDNIEMTISTTAKVMKSYLDKSSIFQKES